MPFPVELLTATWFVAGPTASGKTALSLCLAKQLNAEIVSLDSMAIYRGMDIGTAKPTAEERRAVPHHLIDVADPHEEFSVSEFVRLAAAAAEEIVGRGRVPLFVGGTGLYLRSILRGMSEGPPADWSLRNELQEYAEQHGNEALHARLQQQDPASAEKLHPNDTRRIIRALEVIALTGIPMSQSQHHQPRPEEQRPKATVWLHPPRDWLYHRIDARVDAMVQQGLVDETRQLLQLTPPMSRTARQALGYREIIDHLEGSRTLPDAIEQIKTGTRQFAKRQHTWFRQLEECRQIDVTAECSVEELCRRILAASGP